MRVLLLSIVFAVALSGCSTIIPGSQVRGSGNVVSKQREVPAFTAVDITGVGEVVITQGSIDRVTVETDDNLQDMVLIDVKGDTLTIGLKGNEKTPHATKMTFVVTVRELKSLALSGAAAVRVRELSGDQLTVVHSGAGSVSIAGTVKEQRVTLSGAGSYDAAGLVSDNATVALNGIGSVVVNVRQVLDATLGGTGNIEYIGSPEVRSKVTGLGTIKKR